MLQKHNDEVEQQFLGGLLYKPEKYDDVSWIRDSYFYNPVHGRIFAAITDHINSGTPPTPSLLAKRFEHDDDLSEAGGHKYLQDLVESVISLSNLTSYAQEIYNLHISRAIESAALSINDISNETGDADHKIQEVENIAFNLRLTRDGEVKDANTCVDEALKTIEEAQKGNVGISTGIRDLDGFLKGLKPGKLYIMAGRPSMGKSAVALNIAENAVIAGHNVLFFTQEMGADQLFQRIFARRSGVSIDRQSEKMTDEEFNKIIEVQNDMRTMKLSVKDAECQTVTSILSTSRKSKRKSGLDLVVIDYLGLMDATDKKAQMVHQVAEISRGLKNAATMLGVPVLLLSQLNRSLEGRDDKRPKLSDLRDSGAIEQDADAVMMVYRDEYYIERERPERLKNESKDVYESKLAEWEKKLADSRGRAEIIVAKNRQGRIGTVYTTFDGVRQVFGEEHG